MKQYDLLPVVDANHKQIAGPRDFPECLVSATAHVHTGSGTRKCHRCGKTTAVFVTKPGSPLAWCVECF
jgi:hypothetical protein